MRRADEPMMTERARRGITIRDCLTNTTGLSNPGTMPHFYRQQYRDALTKLGWIPGDDDAPRPNNRERIRALAELPLAAHPGEQFGYHVGYPVLTAVLEEASGQPLDEFFREAIFDPLGMNDTDFYVADDAVHRFGANYAPREVDGEIRLVAVDKAAASEKVVGPKTEFSAGGDMGGVLSTAGDYARFGQMLLNGGELDGVRVLGRKTVDMMIGNHTGDMVIPMTGPGFHWGLGVAMYHGRGRPPLIRSVGTYGWGGAAGTTYFADPGGRTHRRVPDPGDVRRHDAEQHLPGGFSAVGVPSAGLTGMRRAADLPRQRGDGTPSPAKRRDYDRSARFSRCRARVRGVQIGVRGLNTLPISALRGR